jgi:hypothetical protein
MFAKANHPFLISLKARMAIAFAIEVLGVLALLLHNGEMWFGRYISINEQSAFVGLVTVTVFAYLLRMRFRILKEARGSFLAAIGQERASINTAFAEMESVIAKAQATLTSLGEKAFAEALKTTELVSEIALQHNEATRPDGFELAYQVLVAIDCIRFSIKLTGQSGEEPNYLRQVNLREEASFHLLDALDRLQSAEANFQENFRPQLPNNLEGRFRNRSSAIH